MFWDGERWLPGVGRPQAQPRKRSDRRLRNRLSVVLTALALVGVLLPFAGAAGITEVAASTPSGRTLLATWSADSKVAVYQETNRKVSYTGAWATTRYANYLGGEAKAANAGGAKATIKFRGAAVAWVGPVGPTRGKANLYIDGKLVKTVSTWASRFSPTRVLFQKSWNAAGTHSVSIVTAGTRGHPTVAIDAFLVRLDTALTPTPAPKPAVVPIALGAYLPDSLWGGAPIDAYKAQTGAVPAIVMDFLDWDTKTIDTDRLDAIIARGSMPVISWVPGIGDSVDQPQFALRTIAAGADDAWIRPWARQLALWDKTVYIRFAHEMNGWWSPWCVGVNGNTSADFVSAWRHVVEVFRSQGATNVKWVWSPNIDIPGRTASLASIFPGDSYVDWVGLDGYNWGTLKPGGSWQTFGQVFGPSYREITSLTGRPLMIAETASTEVGGDKAAWIRSAFLSELPASFPRVRAVVWWDKAKETNWQIDSSPASRAAFDSVAGSLGYAGRLP